jgi:serine/threonine protein kinase
MVFPGATTGAAGAAASPARGAPRAPVKVFPEATVATTTSVTVETSATGTKLINQYEVLEKLGAGSFAKVKKVRSLANEGVFAMKMFHRAALRKPRMNAERTTALDDVLREISIMSRLAHPNVVRLVEVINDPDHERLYMVLEYCNQGPLMKKNMGDYSFALPEVRQFARDILEGVKYLHDHRVVHRDLKPENLLLSDGVVKLSDFGVSEEYEGDDDALRRTAGTPAFTAPELITAGQPRARGRQVDVFAVGVSLYCLSFSRTPFDGATVMEVYDSIRTHTVVFPDSAPPEQVELLRGLLERSPERRLSIEAALRSPFLEGTVARTEHFNEPFQ